MKRLYERYGMTFGAAYTALGQWASDARGPDNAASGDLDIFGGWVVLGRGTPNTGTIGFWRSSVVRPAMAWSATMRARSAA